MLMPVHLILIILQVNARLSWLKWVLSYSVTIDLLKDSQMNVRMTYPNSNVVALGMKMKYVTEF